MAAQPKPLPVEGPHYLEGGGILGWLTTVDHKRVAVLYGVTALLLMLVGGTEAMLIRTQLMRPDNHVLTAAWYNQIFTMHGTTMIFLVIMPLETGFFANFLIPLQIGARDVAFPRINALSYWLFLAGAVFMHLGLVTHVLNLGTVPSGLPNAGWFGYANLTESQYSPGLNIDFWDIGLLILGVSSVLAALNFFVTIVNMRAPGMTFMRMPMFMWAILVTTILILLAFPALTVGLIFLFLDRFFGTHFYRVTAGATPILWQHLFWIFGHPEVYIMVLPGFGLVSEILPVFAKKPIFGYKAIAASSVAIAFLGFLVWAHHMFATPTPLVVLIFVMISSFLIAVPTGVKIFNWIGTLWNGSIEFKTPLLYCAGFIALFLIGGISGVFLAIVPVDWQLNETYFVVAHIHFVLVGGAVFTIFAGLYYWFPKITGRMLSETLGKLSFWFMFVGTLTTFLIQHAMGLEGMPRRIYEYQNVGSLAAENLVSTIGAFILGFGVLLTVINIARSVKVGAIAGPDPWKGNTLEWYTTSPPPVNNFDVIPRVRSAEPMKDFRREIERRTKAVPVPTPAGAGVAAVGETAQAST